MSPGLAQRDWLVALGEYVRRARPGAGGVGGTAPQSGLALLALLLAMLACSSPCVRRGGHFEVIPWEFPAGMAGVPWWEGGARPGAAPWEPWACYIQFGIPGICFPTGPREWFPGATGILGWDSQSSCECPWIPVSVPGAAWDSGRCWDWYWMGLMSFPKQIPEIPGFP